MNLSGSRTLQNLMRAFAGECQARTRYYFAAKAAQNEKLPVLGRAFAYTGDQEYEHAGIFWKHLRSAGLSNVDICAGYPVDLETDSLSLLRAAQHAEAEEHGIIYPEFARVAREEGFAQIAAEFSAIAAIEQSHSERFALMANWLESGRLFSTGGEKQRWVCLNCGMVLETDKVPEQCPVCRHEQGYFIRAEYAPFAAG